MTKMHVCAIDKATGACGDGVRVALSSAACGPRERYVCTSGDRTAGRAAAWRRASRGPLRHQSPCLGMLVRHCCAGALPQN
jgi:hypothetical protein